MKTGHYGFGNIDFFQQKKAIADRFYAIAPKLKDLSKEGFYREAVQDFRDALSSTTHDLGRLPLVSKDGYSPNKKKTDCVLCLIGEFVQDYWDFCTAKCEYAVETKLQGLESIVKKGFNAFEVKGNLYKGYRLVEKE